MNEPMKAHRNDGRQDTRAQFLEWRPARRSAAPDYDGNRVASCGFCGSVRPDELAAALKAGATLEAADRKYGWPHKFYVNRFPNPFPDALKITTRIYGPNGRQDGPAEPEGSTIHAKFYTEHLLDASPEDRDVIEQAMGLHVAFLRDGGIAWWGYGKPRPDSLPKE